MKSKPTRDVIIVLQDAERDDVTSMGIVVAATQGMRPSQEQLGRYGTVMAVGPEVDQDQLKVGDRVCYGEFDYPEYREDGIRYKVLQDKDIVGVIDEPL